MATLKYSRQREAIKRCLTDRMDHPTAEMIYASLHEEDPRLSLGTVYRNLALLTQLGEIRKIPTGDGPDRFDGNISRHFHFICRKCHCVADLMFPDTDHLMAIMAKWVCRVCGYIYEGETAPAACPQCKAPASKFDKMEEGKITWACEHEVGIIDGVPEDIITDLRSNFNGECSEVGMYLAMSRVAFREGYPEIGLYWEKAAYEEEEHAAKFAEILGEVVTPSTKKNLEMRVDAEAGATAGKLDLAKRAKALNLDAIHDTVHEMAKDEARHGKAFKGLLDRYFG